MKIATPIITLIVGVALAASLLFADMTAVSAKKAALANGVPPYLAEALVELFAERRRGKEANVSAITPKILGRRPTSFAEFAARNAALFRGEQAPPKV